MCAVLLWHQALCKLLLSEVESLHVQSPKATTNTRLEMYLADQAFSVPLSIFCIMLLLRLQLSIHVLVLNDDGCI